MTVTKLQFSGNVLRVDNHEFTLEYPVMAAEKVSDKVVVIYDYMSGPGHRQFKNLEAFSLKGEKLWTAEHPSNETADAYVSFISTRPLKVWNFGCYECEIDLESGKLKKSVFTK